MPKLQSAAIGLAFATIAVASPAAAGGYLNGAEAYGYAPAPALIAEPSGGAVFYSYPEVRIRYGNALPYGYGPAYRPGPPDLWRQREVAYDAIFTKEKRIIYDSGRAAQSRAAAEFYAPRRYYRAPAYGVRVGEPIIDPAGACGTFRYWDGAGCVDARYYSRYVNPYKYRFPPRW